MNVKDLEEEINELRKKLSEKEYELFLKKNERVRTSADVNKTSEEKLSNEEVQRYSRQIIMPDIRVGGQLKLKKSSVLIVGAGGLGCPCALYLAGAGIGCIGIVDYDEVELNNLHRQLLHSEGDVGKVKVQSAAEALERLNNRIKVNSYHIQLNSENALSLIQQYSVIVDASDNVATRYLLNDACVLSGKPLVSGSALQWDGQLTVYNYDGGPCYRCVFPEPPPPESVTNCGDGGVLGAIPGVIGVLQALETIKIILNLPGVISQRWLIFDGTDSSFRNFRLREKNRDCKVCGDNASIKSLIDYEQFCGAKANDKNPNLHLLAENERISVKEYSLLREKMSSHVLVDVRKETEFEICHIPGSINIPLNDLTKTKTLNNMKEILHEKKVKSEVLPAVITVCRRGNDSQRAVLKLKEALQDCEVEIKDIVGGLHEWQREVDSSFPVY